MACDWSSDKDNIIPSDEVRYIISVAMKPFAKDFSRI